MIHALKIDPEYFAAVKAGKKQFEIRYNDRDFKVDDLVGLNELTDDRQGYTGRSVLARITYVLEDPKYLQPGYVALGLEEMKVSSTLPTLIVQEDGTILRIEDAPINI